MRSPRRGGFSLLEVILAISILLGSAIVLAELAGIGREHADSAEQLSIAQLLCRTKLNEILAGAAPAEAIQAAAVEDPPGWVYSVEIEPLSRPAPQLGLAVLRVTVAQDVAEGQRAKQFTLTHWIRDPNFQDAAGLDSEASDLDLFWESPDGGLPW